MSERAMLHSLTQKFVDHMGLGEENIRLYYLVKESCTFSRYTFGPGCAHVPDSSVYVCYSEVACGFFLQVAPIG
jgi:hypothetical protein